MKCDKYILWLNGVVKLKNSIILKILNIIDDISILLENPPNEVSKLLKDIKGAEILIDHITNKREQDKIELQKLLKTLKDKNINYISILNDNYPKLLKEIIDPPSGFYYMGTLPDSDASFVTMIGSRKSSEYASIVIDKLGVLLSRHNIIIVSGFALGIDSVAHRAALDNGGKTLAVLACGIDVNYPADNSSLKKQIIQNGCIISELPLGTRPPQGYFHIRNRIMSGLSRATIVAEAGEKSGTSITVNHALNQNRDIFVLPGNITNPLCKGSNKLIQNGCTPIVDLQDIINYYSDNSSLLTFKELPKKTKPAKSSKTKTHKSSIENDFSNSKDILENISDYSDNNNNSGNDINEDEFINKFLENLDSSPSKDNINPKTHVLEGLEKAIYDKLSLEPISIEGLLRKIPDTDYSSLHISIFNLEGKNLLKTLIGQRYIRGSDSI